MRRLKVPTTCSVSLATVSWIRLLAAAVPPSTARNALVMATDILLSSKLVTVPLRLMTRNCPGAVACSRPDGLVSGPAAGAGAVAAVDVPVSVPVCILLWPLGNIKHRGWSDCLTARSCRVIESPAYAPVPHYNPICRGGDRGRTQDRRVMGLMQGCKRRDHLCKTCVKPKVLALANP